MCRAPDPSSRDFASAFCGADAQALAPRLGPPLTGNVDAISQALDSRDWTCRGMRYIGTGTNPKGTFFVYVMRDKDSAEQWWVFTVMGDQVVAIE